MMFLLSGLKTKSQHLLIHKSQQLDLQKFSSFSIGVDEAGRGPLAGPVLAAAVVLNPTQTIQGLADSKILKPKIRQSLFEEIICTSLAYAVTYASVDEIDKMNILQATFLAMRRAVFSLNLPKTKTCIQIDGSLCPKGLPYPAQAHIKGDQFIPEISAASILAKVLRDRWMEKLDKDYPGYGFARHKGYPTKQHRMALKQLGSTAIHRRSFSGVVSA